MGNINDNTENFDMIIGTYCFAVLFVCKSTLG